MLKKRILKVGMFIMIAVVLNLFVINYAEFKFDTKLQFDIKSSTKDEFQVFYDKGMNWTEESSQKYEYQSENKNQKIEFVIPNGVINLRIDFGSTEELVEISNVKLIYGKSKIDILNKLKQSKIKNDILGIHKENKTVKVSKSGIDSFVVLDVSNELFSLQKETGARINKIVKIICLLFVNIVILLLGIKRKNIFSIMREIYDSRVLVWNLSKNDFKTKYAGSYLGIFWAFINPLVTILIYWFVFEFGLKAGAPIPDVPFILWFTSGLIPWFFFSDALVNATNSFVEYSYLVKKVVFKISILPIVKIISALFIHVVFIGVMISIYGIYGKVPTFTFVQIIYYSFCTFALTLACSYATSAIVIFFKDLTQIIGIVLQIGMWMTPIMWSYTIIPQKFQWIAKINPMFYIVEGYRDSLLKNEWFYNNFWGTIYFWSFTTVIFVIGMIIFKKLKPHFSDVL